MRLSGARRITTRTVSVSIVMLPKVAHLGFVDGKLISSNLFSVTYTIQSIDDPAYSI